MQESRMRLDFGALLFGAILLLVGIYYVLTNTLGVALPELNWDMVWPLIVVAIGLGVLYRASNRIGPR